jgi:spermidine synthase
MSQITDLFDDYMQAADSTCDSSPFISEYQGSEYEGVLCLYFNVSQVQSAMYKHAPDDLVLGYTQTMMNFLIFNKQPRHVGMIGLGGGSLQKACYRRLPRAIISVAEINPEVIALRDSFLIPKDDERLIICCEDGADFVRRQRSQFDVLLVDGFDDKGQPPQLCSEQFYSDCYHSLTRQGLLVANVCDDQQLVSRIRQCFRDQVIVTDSDAKSANTIVFAGRGNILAKGRWPPRPERITPPSRRIPDRGQMPACSCGD